MYNRSPTIELTTEDDGSKNTDGNQENEAAALLRKAGGLNLGSGL